MLEIAPSTYWSAKGRPLSARPISHAVVMSLLLALWVRNFSVYGRRKLTKAARRAGHDIGRDQVARLMRQLGIRGASRARKRFTTHADPAHARAPDLVKRDFTAARPDALWVADFTYCSTWSGIVYVAFVIDVYSRRLVGWKAARTMTTALVLDALNMAAWTRRGIALDGLVCHNDAGSPVHLDRLHRPGRRDRRRPLDRDRRRLLRQRDGRIGHGHVQDRTPPQPRRPHRERRPLEGSRRPRDRHLRVGRLVQRRTAPLRARRHHSGRVRSRVPSPISARSGMRKPTQRASIKQAASDCLEREGDEVVTSSSLSSTAASPASNAA